MRAGVCKYFNGIFHNECCDAGVKYDDVIPDPANQSGKALRLPCHTEPYPNATPSQLEQFHRRGKCEKLCLPTVDEIKAYEVETEKMMKEATDRIMKLEPVMSAMRKSFRKSRKGERREIECPTCKGRLVLVMSGHNGHIHGQCSTADCVSFME